MIDLDITAPPMLGWANSNAERSWGAIMFQSAIRCIPLLTVLFSYPLHAADLFGLEIRPEVGEATYDRDLYNHWIDADGDGLDTRQEVLVLESLIIPTVNSNGRVTEGLWSGPYTGFVTSDPSDLDIDHMVPLKEAHRSGAHSWTEERREAYANDLGHLQALIAVKAGANRSKGDRDPANWMPPNRAYWCSYLGDWIAVKMRWELAIDQAEADAIKKGLSVCDKYQSGDHLDGRH